MQASNRIIVNTLVQYGRTIINMVLSLYSVRLVLSILGEGDYGTYALVGGVVSLLSFFTASLVNGTQRFLSVSQGHNNLTELKSVFSNSVLIHICLGFIVFVVLESLTSFIFDGFLNIPEERISAAMIVYQQVVLMVYISFIVSPYRALFVSRENIVFCSIVDVMDGILKVALVLILPFIPLDKLVAYGWIMFSITAFNFLAFAIYGHSKYEECIRPKWSLIDFGYFKKLMGYSGWMLYGAGTLALRNQGLAIMLNRYMGTSINAAYGIGNQISGLVSFVSSSFTNAISPQLMSAFGSEDRGRMWLLAEMQSKYSYLLLSMIGIPTMFEMQSLLQLWLGEVPANTMLFACMFLSMQIVDMLTLGLGIVNRATGIIGKYIFYTSIPKLTILPVGWYMLYSDFPLWTICLFVVFCEAASMVMRIPLIMREGDFDMRGFVHNVMVKTLPPVLASIMVCFLMSALFDFSGRWLGTYAVSMLLFAFLTYKFSLRELERQKINSILAAFWHKIKHN